MNTYLKVWCIINYYPECRGRSIAPAEGHHLIHHNLSALQSLLILTVWVRLISLADHVAEHWESPCPLSPKPLPVTSVLPSKDTSELLREPKQVAWMRVLAFQQWKWEESNATLNLHWRKMVQKTLIERDVFSSVRRVKIRWHFPDIKIILLASFKYCSPEIFQQREERLGKKIAFGEQWSDFPQAHGSPVQVWLHYVGLIIKAFICTGLILIRTRGNKKSSNWKWAALYKHKGFHYLLRIDRCGGFNVRKRVVKG